MTSSPDPPPAWSLPELENDAGETDNPILELVRESGDGEWPLPELDNGETVDEALTEAATTPSTEADSTYQRGFDEGIKQAAVEGEARIKDAVSAVGKVVEYLSAAQNDFAMIRTQNLHGLALAVAHKLILREIAADPSIVKELVERAIVLLPHDTKLEIRLNPEDLETMREHLDHMTPGAGGVSIQWLADPVLERGSFLVESPQRLVDGRTDTALRNLFEQLANE